jgi:hypothetical protein
MRGQRFRIANDAEFAIGKRQISGGQMSLGLIAALTGLCFAGAIAAITIGVRR